MNILRRLPLSRLLLLCGLALVIGVSATAIASGLDTGPTPPSKPLAQAIHDALAGARERPVEGVSASVTWTDHLLEGANLASGDGAGAGGGGELTSSPLVTGASGRLWIAKDGRARIELQSEQGDTEIVYDGHTLSLYDAAGNTLYRYTPSAQEQHEPAPPGGGGGTDGEGRHEAPSVAKIEEALAHLQKHADVSAATPTDVGGQPAYTVRVSPNEAGSLFDGVELSFDADNGAPLRGAVYSTASSSPVMELAASEVSFGPVEGSVFSFAPPADAKVEEVRFSDGAGKPGSHEGDGERPKLSTRGHGPSTIAILEDESSGAHGADGTLEGLPKVTIDGTSASELRTELGTLLTFERSGVRYVLAGSVGPAAVEEVARGL